MRRLANLILGDMDNFEVVVFDIGGVLVDLNYERCVASFESLGFSGARDMVSCYHPASFFGELERGEISRATWCDRIREAGGITVSDEQICDAYCSILESIPLAKLQMLGSLRERGYRLYTLSNMSEVMIGRVKELLEGASRSAEYYFDEMFLSYEMGVMKPSAKIYDDMISRIGVSAERILFIDDGEHNIAAAREKGLQTYLAGAREDFSHIFEE